MQEEENIEESRPLQMRSGYAEHVINNQTFTGPSVFGREPGLSLAMRKKPDLSQAVDMAGGVSKFISYYVF